jgi:hypothetical protein
MTLNIDEQRQEQRRRQHIAAMNTYQHHPHQGMAGAYSHPQSLIPPQTAPYITYGGYRGGLGGMSGRRGGAGGMAFPLIGGMAGGLFLGEALDGDYGGYGGDDFGGGGGFDGGGFDGGGGFN